MLVYKSSLFPLAWCFCVRNSQAYYKLLLILSSLCHFRFPMIERAWDWWMQVFKTESKGWACRSWDYIPAGAFICEYIGTLKRNDQRLEHLLDNSYIFELDLVETMKGLEGREVRCFGWKLEMHLLHQFCLSCSH